jgi:hypothetical protein
MLRHGAGVHCPSDTGSIPHLPPGARGYSQITVSLRVVQMTGRSRFIDYCLMCQTYVPNYPQGNIDGVTLELLSGLAGAESASGSMLNIFVFRGLI